MFWLWCFGRRAGSCALPLQQRSTHDRRARPALAQRRNYPANGIMLAGYRPDGWWLMLAAGVTLAFFVLFFIEYPGKAGFRSKTE